MEPQKIINLLKDSRNYPSKFTTKKWHVNDSETKGQYKKENPIHFITDSTKSCLYDYSDAYILVTRDTTVARGNVNTNVTFKNCTQFKTCRTEICTCTI